MARDSFARDSLAKNEAAGQAGAPPTGRLEYARNTFRFLGAMVSMNLRSAFALRGAFWLQAGFMVANNVLFFVFWLIFFDRFEEIRGWRIGDMSALFGIVACGFGLSIVFAGGVRELSTHIAEGDLDAFLTQPKSPLLHVVTSKTYASGWGDIVSGLGFIFLSGLVEWRTVPLVLVAVLASGAIFTASGVILHSLAFWLGRINALARQLWEFMVTFSTYPRPLFTGALKFVLFSVIPAGFIGYLPLELVRDFAWSGLAVVLLSVVGYAALAVVVWNAGLRRYESGNRFGVRV